MIRPTLAAVLLALAPGWALTPARAQEPVEILIDASNALANTPGGSATFELHADTNSSLAKTLPSASGKVLWRRAEGDEPARVRFTGSGKARQDQDAADFDAIYSDEEVAIIDHQKKDFTRRPLAGRADLRLSSLSELDLGFLTAERPLDESLNAVSVEREGEKTIAGEVCDVLMVTLPPPADGKTRRKYTKERWAIARSDHLPRLIERIGDYPMIGTITISTTLSDLSTTPPDAAQLAMTAPEGYRELGGAKPSPVGVRTERPEPAPRGQAPAAVHKPAAPDFPSAPAFDLTDTNGHQYTNATQGDRVTVFYFWGTWCVGCGPFSPLVSQLAVDMQGKPVDVLGLAVHEKSETAARERVRDNDYKQALVFGADPLIADLRVRVYPTIVVIGPDNTVRYVDRARADATPEEVMGKIRDAIDAALTPPTGG